jgi:hypothetical protein
MVSGWSTRPWTLEQDSISSLRPCAANQLAGRDCVSEHSRFMLRGWCSVCIVQRPTLLCVGHLQADDDYTLRYFVRAGLAPGADTTSLAVVLTLGPTTTGVSVLHCLLVLWRPVVLVWQLWLAFATGCHRPIHHTCSTASTLCEIHCRHLAHVLLPDSPPHPMPPPAAGPWARRSPLTAPPS